MAEYKLQAGSLIDVLTKKELDLSIEPLKDGIDNLRDKSWLQRAVGFETVDANGNLGGGTSGGGTILYTVPAGFEAFLHRLNVNAAGFSASSPLTTGQVVLCRNGNVPANVEYFLPVVGVIAPVIFTEGSNSALWLKSNDNLVIAGSGLPTGTSIFFSMQFRLWPVGKGQAAK